MRKLVLCVLGSVLCSCAGAATDPVATQASGRASAVTVLSAPSSATVSEEPAPATSVSASAAPATTSAKPPEPSLDLAEMRLGEPLAPAAVRARESKWAEVVREVDKAWPSIEKAGQLDEMCAAQALKGRALFALGQDKKAAEAFAKVLAIYKERTLAPLGDTSEPAVLARARVVIEAVSEATFFTAARRHRELTRSKAPVYKGNGEPADVDRYIAGEFGAWFKERLKAVEEVDKAYQGVLSVQPIPSPRWVVKAAERAGALHESLLTDIASTPMPKAWLGSGEFAGRPKQQIRAAFADALKEATLPFVARVKGAYKVCVERAERFNVTIPEVNSCAKWLQDHE